MYSKKELEFDCPNCRENSTIVRGELEEVATDAVVVTPIKVFEDGEFQYGDEESLAGVIRKHQCSICGYVLRKKNGDFVVEQHEVFEWLKEHERERREEGECNQTRRRILTI